METKRQNAQSGGRRLSTDGAFTRTESLVVLALVSLLAALHLAAAGNTRGSSAATVCLNNLRRLALAWRQFADDHAGALAGNLDGGDAQNTANTNKGWCIGWLDFSTSPANTNTLLLLNAQLGAYLNGDARLFRCPADTSTVKFGGKYYPRVRSVSMNCYMGAVNPYTSGYREFKAMADIVEPIPAKAFVFLDEHPDSINDGLFTTDMSGFSPPHPSACIIVDYPAAWHNQGAGLSFADGHAEIWRWHDPRTMPPVQVLQHAQPSPNNPDIARLQAAATSRRQ